MSVIVSELTKVYGTQKAVDNISFEARKGEILGFLGPNGAGKTTTMKMITGYISPVQGTVEVCGVNVAEDPLAAAARTGYLPEHNPLYKDMYVREYLHFVAGLHKVPNPKVRVDEMIEVTGLGREQHKLIQQLSKGYRQRVGLAQALIHDPEVLILDEPTSGLDPNQLLEIRGLIQQLGKEKTVLFSTHIMQEVQALCDRVIIMDRGRLVADDPIELLQQRISGGQFVRVSFDRPVDMAVLRRIQGIRQVKSAGGAAYILDCSAEDDIRPAVFHLAVREGWVLLEMSKEVMSVEDVFQQLTGGQAAGN